MATHQAGAMEREQSAFEVRPEYDKRIGVAHGSFRNIPDQPLRSLWREAGVSEFCGKTGKPARICFTVAISLRATPHLSRVYPGLLGDAQNDCRPSALRGSHHGLHPRGNLF